VLDTERFLFQQQDRLATSEGQITKNLIALYKSLGGGWSPEMQYPEPLPALIKDDVAETKTTQSATTQPS